MTDIVDRLLRPKPWASEALIAEDAAEEIKGLISVPIVFLTAYADESTLNKAKITEPYGYIIKPFKEIELHTTIEMAIYKHNKVSEVKKERMKRSVVRTSPPVSSIPTPLSEKKNGRPQKKMGDIAKTTSAKHRPKTLRGAPVIMKILLRQRGLSNSVELETDPLTQNSYLWDLPCHPSAPPKKSNPPPTPRAWSSSMCETTTRYGSRD
jgi:CheY-like chemotaxis protein